MNQLVSRTVTDNKLHEDSNQHFIHDRGQILWEVCEEFEEYLVQRIFCGAEQDELITVDDLIDEETLWILADHLNSTRNILRNDNNNIQSIAQIDYDS
ncbi:MAG: hypothetical protein LBC74_13750, partial [Planctomycetaceae bacterium]|nr:hypothetical protein [Planctomycetaceae bacterium]